MTPSRPYLLRALNEWILDNQCTPYVVVDATVSEVDVPEQHVKNGQIVLNINPGAVRALEINNEALSFEARFGGNSRLIYVPIEAVMAVYAKENGQGMVFGWENEPTDPETPPDKPGKADKPGNRVSGKKTSANKPGLKVVK